MAKNVKTFSLTNNFSFEIYFFILGGEVKRVDAYINTHTPKQVGAKGKSHQVDSVLNVEPHVGNQSHDPKIIT